MGLPQQFADRFDGHVLLDLARHGFGVAHQFLVGIGTAEQAAAAPGADGGVLPLGPRLGLALRGLFIELLADAAQQRLAPCFVGTVGLLARGALTVGRGPGGSLLVGSATRGFGLSGRRCLLLCRLAGCLCLRGLLAGRFRTLSLGTGMRFLQGLLADSLDLRRLLAQRFLSRSLTPFSLLLQSLLPGRLGLGLSLTLGLKAFGFGLYGLLPQSLLPCCLALGGFLLQCPLPGRCGALTFGLFSGLAGLHLAQGQLALSSHSFGLALPGRLLRGFGLSTQRSLLLRLVGPLGLPARCLRAHLRLTLCFGAFRLGLRGRLAPGQLARLLLDAKRLEPGRTQTVGFTLSSCLALCLLQGGCFCCGLDFSGLTHSGLGGSQCGIALACLRQRLLRGQSGSLPFGFGLFSCGPFGLPQLGPAAFHLGLLGCVGSCAVCGLAFCLGTQAFIRWLRHIKRGFGDCVGLQGDLNRRFGRPQGRQLGHQNSGTEGGADVQR